MQPLQLQSTRKLSLPHDSQTIDSQDILYIYIYNCVPVMANVYGMGVAMVCMMCTQSC